MDFNIRRSEFTPTETLGVLSINRQLQCFTLEPPKRNNEINTSCIPTGQYRIKTYQSKKFKRTCIKLYDVYGREFISIHNGNTERDTMGCILVASKISKQESRYLIDSRPTLKIITDKLNGHEGLLTIQEGF